MIRFSFVFLFSGVLLGQRSMQYIAALTVFVFYVVYDNAVCLKQFLDRSPFKQSPLLVLEMHFIGKLMDFCGQKDAVVVFAGEIVEDVFVS
jgi:hypothetical protein